MDIICGPVGKCKNCNHYLFLKSGGKVEHFTRAYHSFGYSYTTERCYAGSCKCENPEINYETLSKRDLELVKIIQEKGVDQIG